MWLSGRVFGDSSTVVQPETFLMAMAMAREKQYSLAVPYLSWAYHHLGELKETCKQVVRIYGPWALVLSWLGCYFLQAYSTLTR